MYAKYKIRGIVMLLLELGCFLHRRAAQLQLGHARMFLLRALDLDGLSRRNRPACDNGEGTELGSHGWPGVTQREKKNGKVMQNEKCYFYNL